MGRRRALAPGPEADVRRSRPEADVPEVSKGGEADTPSALPTMCPAQPSTRLSMRKLQTAVQAKSQQLRSRSDLSEKAVRGRQPRKRRLRGGSGGTRSDHISAKIIRCQLTVTKGAVNKMNSRIEMFFKTIPACLEAMKAAPHPACQELL